MTPPSKRATETLTAFGRRRDADRVVVKIDRTRQRIVVEFRDVDRIRRRRFFACDRHGEAEAVAWAEHFTRERADLRVGRSAPAPISQRALWREYTASPAWADLRPKTQVTYAARWQTWERVTGPDFEAQRLLIRDIDRCVMQLRKVGRAINQVRQIVNVARIVYNWGQSRRLLGANDFAIYRWKQPKDAKVESPGEYSQKEYDAILAQLPPQHRKLWRAHVVWVLTEAQGPRANAALHLTWDDIHDGAIHWPAKYQKNGKGYTQPLTFDAWAAIETARYWREVAATPNSHLAHDRRAARERAASSVYVVPAVAEKTQRAGKAWSYQAIWKCVRDAEDRAGVAHQRYRLLHGNRRKATGDVIAATGDRMLGLEYIGDSDPKQLPKYDKRVQERLEKAATAKEGRP